MQLIAVHRLQRALYILTQVEDDAGEVKAIVAAQTLQVFCSANDGNGGNLLARLSLIQNGCGAVQEVFTTENE